MIGLHKIIDLIDTEKIEAAPCVPKDTLLIGSEILKHYGKSAIAFDMGCYDDLKHFKIIPGLIRLPYSVCWFEYSVTYDGLTNQHGLFCYCNPKIENKIVIVFISNVIGHGWVVTGMCGLVINDNNFGFIFPPNTKPSIKEYLIKTDCETLGAFLSAMNCINVKKVKNYPPEKLQKKRIKNSKQPLFSYWTLHLKIPNDSRNNGSGGDGSHASPRLHLRRGHPREYKPGKWTWVQPCVVGNKKNGIVMKDYAKK